MVIRIHQWRPLGLKFSLCVFLKHLFYFRVVLDLQESYEDSTDSFHILHIKIILLIFYINMVHLSLSSIQSLSHVRLFVTLQITARQASLSITNSWRLLKLMSIESVMPSSHLIICHPLLLLPPTPPSIRVFSNESTPRKVAKVLEFWLQHPSFQWTSRTYFLQDGLVGSPCIPRDSQESSPIPQFKSINSSALSFLYSPALISVPDYRKNNSFD